MNTTPLRIGFLISLIAGLILAVVIVLLPNELAFKLLNNQAIEAKASGDFSEADGLFDEALKRYPSWNLITKNNALGNLYEKGQYASLDTMLAHVKEQECSLTNKSLSAFCENIYYLDGMTQYRLGEHAKSQDQAERFEKAIKSFKVATLINAANTWAQDNIDFIRNKNDEKKQEQQKTQSASQDSNESKESSSEHNEQTSKESKDSDNSSNAAEQNEQVKESESGKTGANDSDTQQGKVNEEQESRLPEDMQKALNEAQQQLEQSAQNDQRGFNRSRSQAEKNEDQYDPFNTLRNDPFFDNFFGNSLFQDSPFQKNFHKNVGNSNEKDW